MSSTVSNNASDEVKGPLIFSCKECKTIVGDSFAFCGSNEEANTITLSASSNIQRTKDLYTSYDSLDHGSSYFVFVCSSCQQPLGRYYITTSNDIDDLREKFTFDIGTITSYELGKSQHGKSLDPVVKKVETEPSELHKLHEELLKIQVVIINLSERLLAVESQRPVGGNSHSVLAVRQSIYEDVNSNSSNNNINNNSNNNSGYNGSGSSSDGRSANKKIKN